MGPGYRSNEISAVDIIPAPYSDKEMLALTGRTHGRDGQSPLCRSRLGGDKESTRREETRRSHDRRKPLAARAAMGAPLLHFLPFMFMSPPPTARDIPD